MLALVLVLLLLLSSSQRWYLFLFYQSPNLNNKLRTLTDKCLTKIDQFQFSNDEKVSTVRMRGPLGGANMTSNSVGLLFYSVLSTFLPSKVMMFESNSLTY